MKKLLFSSLAAVALVSLSACSSEEPLGNAGENDGTLRFTVSLPQQMSTKAFGDASTLVCNNLKVSIFNNDQTPKHLQDVEFDVFGQGVSTADVELKLVPGETYNLVFHAQKKESTVPSFEAGVLTYTPTASSVNTEDHDIFCSTLKGVTADGKLKEVSLKRPVAQINLGTDDLESSLVAEVINGATVRFSYQADGLYNTINLLTDETTPVEGTSNMTFSTTEFEHNNTNFPKDGYANLLSMYVLAPTEGTTITGKFEFLKGETVINTVEIQNMPLTANHRTNVFGSLLTSAHKFSCEIEANFDFNDDVAVISPLPEDAEKVAEVNGLYSLVNEETNVTDYYVGTGEALKYMHDNANKFTSRGKHAVINLYANIDYKGLEWTQINDNTDYDIFIDGINGNGFTIYNLDLTQPMFWGAGSKFYIRNLNVENVTVNGEGKYHNAIFFAQVYGNYELTNVHVKNASIKGMYEVAPFAGRVYSEGRNNASLTISNCSAEKIYIEANGVMLNSGGQAEYYDCNASAVVGWVSAGDQISFKNVVVNDITFKTTAGFLIGEGGYTKGGPANPASIQAMTDSEITVTGVTKLTF